MHTADTIAAIATAAGQGGVGIIRISGPETRTLLTRLFRPLSASASSLRPWMLHRGCVLDVNGRHLDDALAVMMPAPRTFTGEDVAELHCHGSPALLALVLEAVLHCGARLAQRGEFSRRAFLNGRMDLSQAEAVAELIAAHGPESARWASARLEGSLGKHIRKLRETVDALRAQLCLAVDFPDDEVDADLSAEGFAIASLTIIKALDALILAYERTRPWREGLAVALAGPVNAGKSSLLNALLGRERALVSDIPGTTRDYLEEQVRIGGLPVRLVDTAGLRALNESTGTQLEALGMALGKKVATQADVVLLLVNGSEPDQPLTEALLHEFGPKKTILLWNKSDLAKPEPWFFEGPCAAAAALCIEAKNGHGLEALGPVLRKVAYADTSSVEPEADLLVPNLRQTEALRRAGEELRALGDDVSNAVPWDLCAVRLDTVAAALAEVTGQSAPDEVLNSIFASFCIGK